MALKLGRLFNVSPELWMGIQAEFDLEARLSCQKTIERDIRPLVKLKAA
jgi:plasmid maintenance system antidote protein VapI